MKISYNWLKQYIDTDLDPVEAGKILTDTGLEVEGLEKIELIPGGLKGLVIGEVKEKEKHPDADRLNVTKVDVGSDEWLTIVCGAPNVEVGQKVLVATTGATIHPTNGEPFPIKRAKIRGVESNGMICAEDEVGLGEAHDGIMVLDTDAAVGTAASTYFNIEEDWMIEIGLTPNRADGMSHIGVARDLLAALKFQDEAYRNKRLNLPSVDDFAVDNNSLPIEVVVEDHHACPRYAGVTIADVKVAPSPDWLQNRLKAIGAKPINNVVDITNFVLHEYGQPLHAFDVAAISGNKVVVKQVTEGTKFVTLDDEERSLSSEDLMICNAEEGMCIAGVFGGAKSGVTEATTNVFLESAYFDPVTVRKTAKRHGLNTDASFRFERGVDPNITITALKRAALLIKEIAGGSIASEIFDSYPNPIEPFAVAFSYANCDRLIGKALERDVIQSILGWLDIEVTASTAEGLTLSVPPYRVDVQREADVVEEVLRIYGYNNIAIPSKLNASISYAPKPDKEKVQNVVADLLSANGFAEILSNSLTSAAYTEVAAADHIKEAFHVEMLNPLSNELSVMRQTLLFNGLEAIAYNQNRKNEDLKLYEFGSVYHKYESGYNENKRLAVFMTGKMTAESWNTANDKTSFYDLKAAVHLILQRLGINKNRKASAVSSALFDEGMLYKIARRKAVEFGWVKSSILKHFGIKQEVFFADFDWDVVIELLVMNKVKYKEVAKFPSVRRDLSLLLDAEVKFSDIETLAFQSEQKLLKEVGLFDVYQGKNMEVGKKSYAVSFTLQDEEKTLTDKQIDKIMEKIQRAVENQLGAVLR